MRQLMIALLLCSATPWSLAQAAPPEAPTKIFQGRDLFSLQYAADPQIRPDGRAVAYARMSFEYQRLDLLQTVNRYRIGFQLNF